MLKPSDFNDAVPQFQNGNYASNPINPQYVEEPSSTDYNHGVEPLQTLPAQWWNWFINKFTSRFNKVNIYVKNLFNELAQLLSLVNVTPDGTESAVTDGQLKNAFKELYPNYINTKLALGSTYVKQTQRVNGHALSGDVIVTKDDVGLGNVVNTGDSATPTENGTTKFTTGGAYTELNKKQDKTLSTALDINGSNATTVELALSRLNGASYITANYGVTASSVTYYKLSFDFGVEKAFRTVSFLVTGRQVTDSMILTIGGNGGSVDNWVVSAVLHGVNKRIAFKYNYTTSKVNIYVKLSEWQAYNITQIEGEKVVFTTETSSESDFTSAQAMDIFKINDMVDLSTVAPIFSTTTSYVVGDYVIYNRSLYRCIVAHSAGAWNASHFTLVTVGDELENKANNASLAVPSDATLHYSFDDVPDFPDGTAVYYRNKNFTLSDGWAGTGNIITVPNGILTIDNVATSYVYKSITSGSIVKSVVISSVNKTIKLYATIDGAPTTLLTQVVKASVPTEFIAYIPSGIITAIGFDGLQTSSKFEIMSFYVGDGSYSTPIIDNSGDNINAVNNGGIAVQGVCGKGVYFPSSLQTIAIPTSKIPAPTSNDDFTISCWVMKGSGYTNDTGSTTKGVIRIGASAGLIGITRNGNQFGCEIRDNTVGSKVVTFTASNNVLYHIVAVLSGTTHTMKLYVNGVLEGETGAVTAGFQFGSGNTQWTIWGNSQVGGVAPTSTQQPAMLDDVMFFNRALSADEVTALYLNKANTPKFYDINNYLLDNRSAVPAENGTDLFTTGGAYALQQSINGKAPKDHSSSSTEYGVATSSYYGHVKIANAFGMKMLTESIRLEPPPYTLIGTYLPSPWAIYVNTIVFLPRTITLTARYRYDPFAPSPLSRTYYVLSFDASGTPSYESFTLSPSDGHDDTHVITVKRIVFIFYEDITSLGVAV